MDGVGVRPVKEVAVGIDAFTKEEYVSQFKLYKEFISIAYIDKAWTFKSPNGILKQGLSEHDEIEAKIFIGNTLVCDDLEEAKHLSSTGERFKVVFVDGILLTKAGTMIGEEQKQKAAMELLEQYTQFKQHAEKEGDNKINKKEKDSLKLKRLESAYFLFMNERRDALVAESKSQVEIAKLTREEWKNMTKTQKASYEIVAKQNKKYTQEIKVYKQNKREDELLQVLKQEALQLLKKREN
ncbi:high mobility group B protein 6-like protein [Tanacetum coccineum]